MTLENKAVDEMYPKPPSEAKLKEIKKAKKYKEPKGKYERVDARTFKLVKDETN